MKNLIIDGNNLAYRAKYSFSLSNHGVDVSITYGFLRVLFSLISKFSPDSVLVAWDYGIPDHRRKRMPEYKANRKDKGMDIHEYEDMIRQMNLLERTLPMFGILSVRISNCEADDIMYHAAEIFDGESIIVSTDKDMFQSISETTKVHNPTKEQTYDAEEFEDEFGIPPSKFVNWLAIQGDSVDNIEGVRGIGPVTATKLINKWGSANTIMNAAIGIHPDKSMSESLAEKISAVGMDKLTDNIFVIALYVDRCGVRHRISKLVRDYLPAAPTAVKRFMLDNAFMSLVDKVGYLKKLIAPTLLDGHRYPVVCNYRRPYGKDQ